MVHYIVETHVGFHLRCLDQVNVLQTLLFLPLSSSSSSYHYHRYLTWPSHHLPSCCSYEHGCYLHLILFLAYFIISTFLCVSRRLTVQQLFENDAEDCSSSQPPLCRENMIPSRWLSGDFWAAETTGKNLEMKWVNWTESISRLPLPQHAIDVERRRPGWVWPIRVLKWHWCRSEKILWVWSYVIVM